MGRQRSVLVAVVVGLGLAHHPQLVRAQPGDPAGDPVEQTYLEARALWQGNQLEQALPLLERLLTDHLDHPTAEHAVTLLLDALNRLGRYNQLTAWVDRLMEEKELLARSPQAAETLGALQRQARRKHAERLEALGDYQGCGEAYLALSRTDASARDADEVLYNAGVCFGEAGSMSASIQMYTQVVDRFPASALARRALMRLATTLDAIAYYEQAAPRYEAFAARYAAERDADAALLRAIELRAALGQRREALAATERYLKLFGRKRAADAARLWLAAVELHDPGDLDARIAHLRRYAREHARAGSAAELTVAHAKLGELLWKKSCATPDATGLCLRRVRLSKAQQAVARCAPLPLLAPAPRKATLVREAHAAFNLAIQAYERAARDGATPAAASHAGRMARFYLAETEVEAVLAMEGPNLTGIGASPSRAALKRFSDWVDESQRKVARVSGDANGLYAELLRAPAAQPWTAAAMLRAAQARRAFATVMASLEIPTELATGPYAADATKAYCATLAEQTRPFFEFSANALEACVAAPGSYDWSLACARALEAAEPDRYPPLRERLGHATAAPLLDRGAALLSATPAAR